MCKGFGESHQNMSSFFLQEDEALLIPHKPDLLSVELDKKNA